MPSPTATRLGLNARHPKTAQLFKDVGFIPTFVDLNIDIRFAILGDGRHRAEYATWLRCPERLCECRDL